MNKHGEVQKLLLPYSKDSKFWGLSRVYTLTKCGAELNQVWVEVSLGGGLCPSCCEFESRHQMQYFFVPKIVLLVLNRH